MPFSHSSQLSVIVGFIEQLNPRSLLDVGTGMGQYGLLARNSLENVNLFAVEGANGRQRSKEEWGARIDGIEGCVGYITPVHNYAYNQLMIGDAMAVLADLTDNSYELLLAIDILEHLSKSDGAVFLGHLKRIASRAVLVSTPKEFIPQEVEANPYENHRSLWSREELASLGYREILENALSWIAILRHDPNVTV